MCGCIIHNKTNNKPLENREGEFACHADFKGIAKRN